MDSLFTIDVDIKSLTAGFNELERGQLPFATMKALNATGVDIQVAERKRMREVFTVRRSDWVDRSVKITHFAKKTELWTTIAIAPPGGPSRVDILGKFETDSEKAGRTSHGVAIPVGAKRTKADIVKANQRPRAFHLQRQGNRVVGSDGTYIVKLPDGRELLLQRKAATKRSRRLGAKAAPRPATLLYIFQSKVAIRPDLHYVPTAAQVVERMWVSRFGESFTLAMSSAR